MGVLESLERAIRGSPIPESPNRSRKKLKNSKFRGETTEGAGLVHGPYNTTNYVPLISISPEVAESQDDVEVQVGSPGSYEVFVINRALLCKASDYCRRQLTGSSNNKEKPIVLSDFEPLSFKLFAQWIEDPRPSVSYNPDGVPEEPWLSNAASTWLLGKKLQCSEAFDRYALSHFIQNCAFMAFGPWERIEMERIKGSLCRFSDHWVAWNSRFAGPEPNEYSGLRAARASPNVPDTDPRTYDIEHWYSECGKYMRPRCPHDPIARLNRLEMAKRPKPKAPAEWGRSEELQCEVYCPSSLVRSR